MRADEFMKYKNWAVAGDVLNPQKYAHRILNRLKSSGFNAVGVKPGVNEQGVCSSLKDTEQKIDVLDLCINPAAGIKIVQEASELGISKVLIQPGAESDKILDFCREKGIDAVEGCALVELSNM